MPLVRRLERNTATTSSSNSFLRKLKRHSSPSPSPLSSPTHQESSFEASLEAGLQTRDYFTSKQYGHQASSKATTPQTNSLSGTPFEIESPVSSTSSIMVPNPGTLLPKIPKPSLGHSQSQHSMTLSKVINRTKRVLDRGTSAATTGTAAAAGHNSDAIDSPLSLDPNQRRFGRDTAQIFANHELTASILPEVPPFVKTPRVFVFMLCRPSFFHSSTPQAIHTPPLSRKEKKVEREREKEKREREREKEQASPGNATIPLDFVRFVFIRLTDSGDVLVYPLMPGPTERVCFDYFDPNPLSATAAPSMTSTFARKTKRFQEDAATASSSTATVAFPAPILATTLPLQSTADDLPTAYQPLDRLRREDAMDREINEIVAMIGTAGEEWEVFGHVDGMRVTEMDEVSEEGAGTVFEMTDATERRTMLLRARTTKERRKFINTMRFLREGRFGPINRWVRWKETNGENSMQGDGKLLYIYIYIYTFHPEALHCSLLSLTLHDLMFFIRFPFGFLALTFSPDFVTVAAAV